MKISAREYFQKGKLIRWVSWKEDSVTTFGDHQVEFDLESGRVIRSAGGETDVIAMIEKGHKGRVLPKFYGTVVSESFVVTKRSQDWLSGLTGNAMFDISLKSSGLAVSNLVMRFDYYDSFRVGNLLELKLIRGERGDNYRSFIEGICADEFQDLAEILACLLLHFNEDRGSGS